MVAMNHRSSFSSRGTPPPPSITMTRVPSSSFSLLSKSCRRSPPSPPDDDVPSESWHDFHHRYHSPNYHYSARNLDFISRNPDAFHQIQRRTSYYAGDEPMAMRATALKQQRQPSKRRLRVFFLFDLCQHRKTTAAACQ